MESTFSGKADSSFALKSSYQFIFINNKSNFNWLQSLPATSYKLLSAKNILRPQLKFKEKIRNCSGPFVPKIKEKPHSSKPLAILLELNDLGDEEFGHPYEFELERFTPNPKFLTVADEVAPFSKVQDTPLVIVETEKALKSLINDLLVESVIAVDLEVSISKLTISLQFILSFHFSGPFV